MDRELAYAAVTVAVILLGGGLIGFLIGFLTCAWLVEHKR